MENTISLPALKTYVEKKLKRKTMIKVIWNDQEKLTLLLPPNITIQSFIRDPKQGYLFFDQEGKIVQHTIPLTLFETDFHEGKVILHSKLRINNEPLTKEEILFLENLTVD